MRNESRWSPSKFQNRGGVLRASRDPAAVSTSSRMMTDAVARAYEGRLQQFAKGDLIDIGCGTVPFYGTYRSSVQTVTCIDWGESLHENSHVDQLVDLTRTLPYANDSFDTLVLSDVLEHIPNPHDLWKELYRIARPGSTVFCNTPFYYWLHEEPHDYFRYTSHGLRRLCKDAGFNVLELVEVGGLPEVLSDIFAKVLIRVPIIGAAVAIAVQEATYALVTKTKFGEKVSRSTGKVWPLGYLLTARK